MFITLKFISHEEQIPISSVLKFSKSYDSEIYEITLSQIETPFWTWSFVKVQNIVISVSFDQQPFAFEQIKQYLQKL